WWGSRGLAGEARSARGAGRGEGGGDTWSATRFNPAGGALRGSSRSPSARIREGHRDTRPVSSPCRDGEQEAVGYVKIALAAMRSIDAAIDGYLVSSPAVAAAWRSLAGVHR